jgi:predicted membrane channel-forming protein YqfA (hemolysin III family)
MSMYKIFLNRDRDEAYQIHSDRQKGYEFAKNRIMYFVIFGGMFTIVMIYINYSESVASLCALVGMICYLLGYFYCETFWKMEKDNIEFNNALKEHESKHAESS